jgi:hypothetical protein
MQDFPESTAGEQQQSDRCRSKGADLREAVLGLGQVLGMAFARLLAASGVALPTFEMV